MNFYNLHFIAYHFLVTFKTDNIASHMLLFRICSVGKCTYIYMYFIVLTLFYFIYAYVTHICIYRYTHFLLIIEESFLVGVEADNLSC